MIDYASEHGTGTFTQEFLVNVYDPCETLTQLQVPEIETLDLHAFINSRDGRVSIEFSDFTDTQSLQHDDDSLSSYGYVLCGPRIHSLWEVEIDKDGF